MHHLTAPWYADKTECEGRGVYLFMAVGACINATALSVGGMGGRDFAFASTVIGSKRFIYMIDLQCGRLNYTRSGSALGSIGLAWGGNNSFGRALLLFLYIVQVCYSNPKQAKDKQMKNLTTPQAILCGFALVALAIASIPYSSNIVTPAHAYVDRVSKAAICSQDGARCVDVLPFAKRGVDFQNYFLTNTRSIDN